MPVIEGLEYFLLSEIFQFKPNCKLKLLIEKYSHTEIHSFTILQIVNQLNYITRSQNMHDENNQSIIICTPEMEDAINFKALHTLEILSVIVEHITQESQPIFQRNHANSRFRISSSAQIDAEECITQNQTITNMRMARTKYCLHADLQNLLGLNNQKYTMVEIMNSLTLYLANSDTVEIDERNPRIAFIANDPLGDIFNMKAFHTSQKQHIIAHYMTTDINWQTAYDLHEEIFIEESIQFMSHIYLTANATAILINNRQQLERTNCSHLIIEDHVEEYVEEYEVPSAEEAVRPVQAMGRTQSLSSADNTDTEEEIQPMTYAERLDALLTSESETEASKNIKSNIETINTNTMSSTESTDHAKIKSMGLILSTIRTAEAYHNIRAKITYPNSKTLNIAIKIPDPENPDENMQPTLENIHRIQTKSKHDPKVNIICQKITDNRVELLSTTNQLIKRIKTIEQIPTNIEEQKEGSHILQKELLETSKIELHNIKETILKWNAENHYMLKEIAGIINTKRGNYLDQTNNIASQIKSLRHETEERAKTIDLDPEKITDIHKSTAQHNQCINCQIKINTNVPRCSECWRIRKQWIPERPKKRRRVTMNYTKNIFTQESSDGSDQKTRITPVFDDKSSRSSPLQSDIQSNNQKNETCWCCCTRDRNALIIHGKHGHQILCYPCAKKTWNLRAKCPICNRKIEKIVKIINI